MPRRAGQYARQVTHRKKNSVLAMLAAIVLAGVVLAVATDFALVPLLFAEALVIAGTLSLDRWAVPTLVRWSSGAAGEEHVGRLLLELEGEGWVVTHDVHTGRGNIDTIAIGPGGIFTIEVKATSGRLHSDRIDPAMLRQAYAQSKWLERAIGRPARPLLVFSRAYVVGKPVTRQRGVVVLPARMLVHHLTRYPALLSLDQVRRLHEQVDQRLREPILAT